MKKLILITTAMATLLGSCTRECGPCPGAISQIFVHTYGVETTKKDWETRGRNGQIVTTRKDGTLVTQSYHQGQLHGETTYSFPHAKAIARVESFENGRLVSEQHNYRSGAPQERVTVTGAGRTISHWYEVGTPKSREHFKGERLVSGEYFNSSNVLDSKVVDGEGMRIVRDEKGTVLHEDVIAQGQPVKRTAFFVSGEPRAIIPYLVGQVDGTLRTFAAGGLPRTVEEWASGEQHGVTLVFDNGQKIAEELYAHGIKEGVERQFAADGSVSKEITWLAGEQHGPTNYFAQGQLGTDWYHHGHLVRKSTFERLNGYIQTS